MWVGVVVAVAAVLVVLVLWFSRRIAPIQRRNDSESGPKPSLVVAAEQPSAASPAAAAVTVLYKGKKGRVTCCAADDDRLVLCTSDHHVRLVGADRCSAAVAVANSVNFDAVLLSGQAVFAVDGFEGCIHVFGIVKGSSALELRAVSQLPLVLPTKKELVRSVRVARAGGATLVGVQFQSGVTQLYDARSASLVHTISNEKIRTNSFALVADKSAVFVLLGTFDTALSVVKCRFGPGGWTFAREPQLKVGGQDEVERVSASVGGIACIVKGQVWAFSASVSAADEWAVVRWKGPIGGAPAVEAKVSPCGKFVAKLAGGVVSVWNKQLAERTVHVPQLNVVDVHWWNDGDLVLIASGDASVYGVRNPFQ